MGSYLKENREETRMALRAQADFVRTVFSLPATDSLQRILSLDHPQELVRSLSRVDFYWLVKKVGDEDSLPLLQMASYEQWQYLIDMECWQEDRLNIGQASLWLTRLNQADPRRLVTWLRTEGEYFGYFYFSKLITVEVRRTDEVYDLSDGFVSFDNIFFFKVLDPEIEEAIRNILQILAMTDHERYQALLLGIAGSLTSEIEEELYRMRKVRLAEDGLLPFEEALSIYSRLKPESLRRSQTPGSVEFSPNPREGVVVPMTPILHAGKTSLLTESTAGIPDPILMDRIRLEFAGLCNQVIAADGIEVHDLEVLLKVCRKAAGYISLGLERVSGRALPLCGEFLRSNSLLDLFRVGYGLALELKWEAEQWTKKKAWFARQRFGLDFWDEEWGGILSGLLLKRPQLFSPSSGGESYRDFENLSEIDECRAILNGMILLDLLIENIASRSDQEPGRWKETQVLFSALLFTYWARKELGMKPGFEGLTGAQVKNLFEKIRKGEKNPPFRMAEHEKRFINTLTLQAQTLDPGVRRALENTLSLLWSRFGEEYAFLRTADLDTRYVKFFVMAP